MNVVPMQSAAPGIGRSALRASPSRTLRDAADGCVADRHAVLQLLDTALTTKLVWVLRHMRHYFIARRLHGKAIAHEFFVHAAEQQGHADRLADRIVQLGGEPDFVAAGLTAHGRDEDRIGNELSSMIEADFVAARSVVGSFLEMLQFIGDCDPITRQLLEDILASDQRHAAEFVQRAQALCATPTCA
jgi:bacterioferritin